jgi:hypothetical protein
MNYNALQLADTKETNNGAPPLPHVSSLIVVPDPESPASSEKEIERPESSDTITQVTSVFKTRWRLISKSRKVLIFQLLYPVFVIFAGFICCRTYFTNEP